MTNQHGPFANSEQPSDRFVAWKLWVSREIKNSREANGCCIGMLSVLASLPEEYLHKVETAEISPSDHALTKISMALCVPRSTFNPPKNLI